MLLLKPLKIQILDLHQIYYVLIINYHYFRLQ